MTTITTNALIKLTDKEYFAEGAHVSSSTLKTIYDSSPRHLTIPRKDTDAMRFGRAMHSYLLDEPEEFEAKYYVEPEIIKGVPINRRLKDHREFLEALDEANKEKDKVKPEELEVLKLIQTSMYETELAQQYLSGGFAEYAIFSEINGVKVKVKMDYFIPGSNGNPNIVVDLKGCQDASERGFKHEIYSRHYDLQAYMYRAVAMNAYPNDTMFIFAAIEKNQPYSCCWYGASDEMLTNGKRKFEESLDIYRNTVLLGSYPQYNASRTLTFL